MLRVWGLGLRVEGEEDCPGMPVLVRVEGCLGFRVEGLELRVEG